MITAENLRDLRTASVDYPETEALKAQFCKLRTERTPFFLASSELDQVFRWKLRGQYERQSALRAKTPDAVFRAVTEAVFKVVQPDVEYESTIRLGLLTALPGVGIPGRVGDSRSRRTGPVLCHRFPRVARHVP